MRSTAHRPAWAGTDLWEIQAKAPEGTVQPKPNPDMADFDAMERMLSQPDTIAFMLQSLLEDRFQLKAHRETREMPVYELVVAKGGLKMKLSADQAPPDQRVLRMPRGSLEGAAIPFWGVFNAIRNQLDRPIINKTDLKGLYDVKLEWMPDSSPKPVANTAPGISIFTALQEQLGLKLESARGPVEVLVIDSVERPSEN